MTVPKPKKRRSRAKAPGLSPPTDDSPFVDGLAVSPPPVPKKRGRPSLAGTPGERFMIHLQPQTAQMLRNVGGGSISLGVMRLADSHEGVPLVVAEQPRRSNADIRRTERARRRAKAALDVVNQVLNETIGSES